MKSKNHKVFKAVSILKRHKAPLELIEYFLELVDFAEKNNFEDDVNDLIFDACKKFGFSKPYEGDGKERVFRPRLLPKDHPDFAEDTPAVSFMFRVVGRRKQSGELAQEQSYRRGYDQGFNAAVKMLKSRASIKKIESEEKAIHDWRTRRLQILGSRPGSDENFRILNLLGGRNIGLRLRFKVLERDKFRCRLCGKSQEDGATIEVDHKVSLATGGSSTEDNLWTLCFECNRGKHSQSL